MSALSFVAWPVRGVVRGQQRDRFGRKLALSLSSFITSAATMAIAQLPTFAMAGLLAPVLLLPTRLPQGFAAFGEYGGAASFLSEYAPRKMNKLVTVHS